MWKLMRLALPLIFLAPAGPGLPGARAGDSGAPLGAVAPAAKVAKGKRMDVRTAVTEAFCRGIIGEQELGKRFPEVGSRHISLRVKQGWYAKTRHGARSYTANCVWSVDDEPSGRSCAKIDESMRAKGECVSRLFNLHFDCHPENQRAGQTARQRANPRYKPGSGGDLKAGDGGYLLKPGKKLTGFILAVGPCLVTASVLSASGGPLATIARKDLEQIAAAAAAAMP